MGVFIDDAAHWYELNRSLVFVSFTHMQIRFVCLHLKGTIEIAIKDHPEAVDRRDLRVKLWFTIREIVRIQDGLTI